MDLSVLVDRLLPGPGGRLAAVSDAAHASLVATVEKPVVRPAWALLHGTGWLGHPLHAVVITVPIGAWAASGWYDVKSVLTHDERDETAADAALRVGILGAVAAAATGVAQYVDTRGAARRETTVHAATNYVVLGLYLGSWAARRRGARGTGRLLGLSGLSLGSVSAYLGGDLSYRHGVGVRAQSHR